MNFFISLFLLVFTNMPFEVQATANVHARPGSVTCKAVDKGWEEHWGGHSSCRSCLKKHGSCIERCYTNLYECTVVGKSSYTGFSRSFSARAKQRYEAENEAFYRCQSNAEECQLQGCNEERELYSQQRC